MDKALPGGDAREHDKRADVPRRWRQSWIPLFLIFAAITAFFGVAQVDLDRDYLILVRQIAVAAALLGCGIWFLICAPVGWRARAIVVLSPLVLIVGIAVLFKPPHDGDMNLYWTDFGRYEFRFGSDPDEQLPVPDKHGVADDWQPTEFDFPRFLGVNGRSEVYGIELDTNWQDHPPKQLWRRPIGAGWSGFAIVGAYAITQEQRGEHEMVSCYRVTDGEIVWTHWDKHRFDTLNPTGSLGGVGPRATPTIHGGMVITHGPSGLVNCLDVRTGDVIWSHDTLAEFGGENVRWGKSNSPLVVDDKVINSVGAPDGKSLVAFNLESGEVEWTAGGYRSSYASPVLAEIGGVRQIVSLDEGYVTAHRADDGEFLWEHPWPSNSDSKAAVSQPVPISQDRVFLSKGYNQGAELITIKRNEDKWRAKRIWKARTMKTKMSNVVMKDGYVYGLDGGIMQCIELDTGRKVWKVRTGRYGHGQLLLVGDVIVVMTEMQGELVLVRATPDGHHELARYKVFETNSKTWNNPALAGPYLLIRNSEEAVCLKLPLKDDSANLAESL